MWKTARISAREVRHWPWKSDTRSQHSKERWSHYNGSEFPEQGDRRVPQKLQREGERKTIWGKNRRPLDEGGAKTLVIQAFLYLLKFFGGRKAPRINSRQGRELKSRRNLRGFPKLENTREGRSVTIQWKRLLKAPIASKMRDRHTRSYNMFMCLPASNFGQKCLPKRRRSG